MPVSFQEYTRTHVAGLSLPSVSAVAQELLRIKWTADECCAVVLSVAANGAWFVDASDNPRPAGDAVCFSEGTLDPWEPDTALEALAADLINSAADDYLCSH